jgi:hypothetical protein
MIMMQKGQWFITAFTSLAICALTTLSVNAQQTNQSDVTGTTVFNNPIPPNNPVSIPGDPRGGNIFNDNVPGRIRLSEDAIAKSEQLAKKLADADRSCREKQECGEFKQLLEESKTFLGSVNQILDTVRANTVNRAW